jgi:hypothetical protein
MVKLLRKKEHKSRLHQASIGDRCNLCSPLWLIFTRENLASIANNSEISYATIVFNLN